MPDDHIQTSHPGLGTIMKELSDIKSSLAVNTNETSNIKSSISEIKVTIKEIQNDFITRREFDTHTKEIDDKYQKQFTTIEEKVALLNRFIYWIIGIVGTAIVGAVLQLVIK